MTAQQLKSSILNLAITGKLVPQDPHDEPASKLVEQIRKEKDRLIKDKKIKPSKFDSVIFKGEDNLHYEKIGEETRCIEDEIPFEIPSSWTWVRLGKIAKSLSAGGDKPADFSKDKTILKNIPVVANGEYNDGILGYTAEAKIKEASITISGRGTIGFSIVRDYSYFPIVRLLSFSPYKPINIKYINYGLNTLLEVGVGTSIKQLTIPMLAEKLLPLPPLSEQKRIVDKLEEILQLIEKYKEDKEKLDELNLSFPSKLKKSILDYAVKGKLVEQNLEDESVEILLQKIGQEKQRLVKDKKLKADKFPQSTIFIGEDNSPYEKIGKETRCIEDEIPFEIPSSWAWVRLGEICQIYTGDSINQTQKLTKYTNLEDGRCYIATKDVDFDGSIDYENGVKIPFNESRFKIAPKNSVLLCVEGGSAGKKIGYLDCDVCFGNKLCCFNPLLIEPKFIYYYLQSQIFIYSFMQKMSGIISGISLNSIKTIVIAIPPLPEQKRIVEKIELLLPLLKP